MLRKLLLSGILLFLSLQGFSCHCEPYVPDFYKNVLRADLLCLAICEGTGFDFEYNGLQAETAHFRILDPMNMAGQQEGDTILITGQDGFNCGECVTRFSVGDSVFLALGKGFYYEFERDTFYLEGACGKYFLELEEGKNRGLTIPQIKQKISYFKELEGNPSYQMFHPHRVMLFQGKNENIRSLWVDSLKIADDVHYYFNPNIRLAQGHDVCSTPYGASWAGSKVTLKENGDHVFYNMRKDSILVRSMAVPGESWRCYEGSDYLIDARVESADTMNFLGITDSVKSVRFRVFTLQGTEVDHALNQMSLLLSKSHGTVSMLNFHLFPDMEDITVNYMTEVLSLYEIAGIDYPQLGLQNLDWRQVFSFGVGDQFHILEEYESIYGFSVELTDTRVRKTILEVIEAEYSYDVYSYRMERHESIYEQNSGVVSRQYIHDTITRDYQADPAFDYLPDEVVLHNGWANTTLMKGGSVPSKTLEVGPVLGGQEGDSCWHEVAFDGCFPNQTYYRGLGGPYGSCSGGLDSYTVWDTKLVYYLRRSGCWGTPLVVTGEDVHKTAVQVQIYPNPARDQIIIKSSHNITGVRILDNSGRMLLQDEIQGAEGRISLDEFQRGVYLIGVEVEGVYSWEKVIVL